MIYVLLLMESFCLWLPAPTASPNCKQLLLQAYQKFARQTQPSTQNRVMHMELLSEAFYRPDNQQQERSNRTLLQLYAQGARTSLVTPAVVTWQDERYLVTVSKRQKTVLIVKSPAKSGTSPLQGLLAVRDSLIRGGTVTSCQKARNSSEEKQIQLKLAPTAAKRARAQFIDFWINTKTGDLSKMQVTYLPQQVQTRTIISFLKQEELAAPAALPADARRQVLNAQGRLLPAYATYRLVDQTTPVRPR